MKNTFAPYRLEDLNMKVKIIILKSPFSVPYWDFYSLSGKKLKEMNKNKQFVIKLLNDTHLEYWKSPKELQQTSHLLSNSYCLTAYYTNTIMDSLLSRCSTVVLHDQYYVNESGVVRLFSISKPNVYFDQVYEIVENHIMHMGVSYICRTFQPALFIRVRPQMKLKNEQRL
jgi:hypothetical protein